MTETGEGDAPGTGIRSRDQHQDVPRRVDLDPHGPDIPREAALAHLSLADVVVAAGSDDRRGVRDER